MPPPPQYPPPGLPPLPGVPPPGYGYPQQRPTEGMAITSLVLGIVAFPGICCYGVPGLALGVTAVILGRIALGRIRNSNGALGGYGLAQAGWICGLAASLLAGLYFVFYVVMGAFTIFSLLQSTPSPSP
jgi:hypothetical protein